jgi:hypothetical protein
MPPSGATVTHLGSRLKRLPYPSVAFVPEPSAGPAVEIVVNFGVFAGRAASPAEIDRLGEWLLDTTSAVTIVCEERHEIGGHAEGTVHQVRIAIPADCVPVDPAEREQLGDRLLDRATYWARACIAGR